MFRAAVVFIAAVLAAAGAAAQGNPTGAIRGQVVDPDNLPVPGATVTVASPALQGTSVSTISSNCFLSMSAALMFLERRRSRAGFRTTTFSNPSRRTTLMRPARPWPG